MPSHWPAGGITRIGPSRRASSADWCRMFERLWWWSVMLRFYLRRTVLRYLLCSWYGHDPQEQPSESWGSITPMFWYPDIDETVIAPTIRSHQRHNYVLCRRCRHRLASATWDLPVA